MRQTIALICLGICTVISGSPSDALCEIIRKRFIKTNVLLWKIAISASRFTLFFLIQFRQLYLVTSFIRFLSNSLKRFNKNKFFEKDFNPLIRH